MRTRVNNQLPNNLPQLQNCVKRDSQGYKDEVSFLDCFEFVGCFTDSIYLFFRSSCNNSSISNHYWSCFKSIQATMIRASKIWSCSWPMCLSAIPKNWSTFPVIL